MSEPTNTIKMKLNGREVTATKGMTVMEVAQREKVKIPHFCWHPGLKVAGVCRFCMVEVVGRPKLEIACNLPVAEGMEINTESEKSKDAHKWALEFHLVNHPLDCPICDQAGECGLQDYYMEVGQYQSQMTRPKVLKPKALEVGGDLVLDTERCILCSRCVRFEDEVTKTGALGIFDRGDRAIIGTYPGRKLEHNYTGNLVDVCPVGAFTQKSFRFKQRVWFLKDKKATCPGCSTGCSVRVYAKPESRKFFRLKPEYSEVNKYWMCDTGRQSYDHLNKENRLLYAQAEGHDVTFEDGLGTLGQKLSTTPVTDVALLVSAQYTNEEYEDLFNFFVRQLGVQRVYQWREPSENREAFDGILQRGDRNANTFGLVESLKKFGFKGDVKNEFDDLMTAKPKVVIALAPELSTTFPNLPQQMQSLATLPFVSLWTVDGQSQRFAFPHALPMKGFAEKSGTFKNFEGRIGQLEAVFPAGAEHARSVSETVALLAKGMGK